MTANDGSKTTQEPNFLAIGTVLCILICLCVVWVFICLIHLKPISEADAANFRRTFLVSLTVEQAKSDFAQKDPVIHTLQQRAVDGKLWALVAAAYEKSAAIKRLEEQQRQLMAQDQTDDASIAETRDAIAGLLSEASVAEKERLQIEQLWNDSLRIALRCNFGDGGARSFDEAIFKYTRWLRDQNKKPPPK